MCHGGVISAASLAFMEHALHTARPFRLEPENTSITEWVLPADEPAGRPPSWVLARFNDYAHLP